MSTLFIIAVSKVVCTEVNSRTSCSPLKFENVQTDTHFTWSLKPQSALFGCSELRRKESRRPRGPFSRLPTHSGQVCLCVFMCACACVCISIKAGPYQLLMVNHAQIHAVTPKAAAPEQQAVIRKHLRYLQQLLHVVIHSPHFAFFFLQPDPFITGWLSRMCAHWREKMRAKEKKRKKNPPWHFTSLEGNELSQSWGGGDGVNKSAFCVVLKSGRLFAKQTGFRSLALEPDFFQFSN